MSRTFVDVLKRLEFQVLKSSAPVSDARRVAMTQSILNAMIHQGDIIIDADMPTTFLGCILDWSKGSSANDLVVSIEKGVYSVIQNLDSVNVNVAVDVTDYYNDTTEGGAYYGGDQTYYSSAA